MISRGYNVPHDNEVLVLKGEPGEPGEIGLQGNHYYLEDIRFYVIMKFGSERGT